MAGVPRRDQLAYWVDAICCAFLHVDCEPDRQRPFFGELNSDSLGELRIGTVRATAQTITRSARQIACHPAGVFDLGIQCSGNALMTQDGQQVLLRPGDFVLHDSTRPWQLTFDGDFCQTVLQIPRPALLDRLGSAEGLGALRIDGSTGIGGMVSKVLRELPSQLEAIPAAMHFRLCQNLLDLIATAILAQGDGGRTVSAETTLVRVKLWIETHLAEELFAERIASSCGVSSRHLNRLFEPDGISLMRYVWQRRLARCHQNLTDPAMRDRSITELAFAAGFNDLSHFSRAYRAHYGQAPRDSRRKNFWASLRESA